MTEAQTLRIALDPADPTHQVWYRGDRLIARFTIAAAESAIRVATDALERQKAHATGQRVVLPPGVVL